VTYPWKLIQLPPRCLLIPIKDHETAELRMKPVLLSSGLGLGLEAPREQYFEVLVLGGLVLVLQNRSCFGFDFKLNIVLVCSRRIISNNCFGACATFT
jgi:hypothetical protein